ncbi:ATP-dependent RNA helicase-like protein 1 [Leptotrombidium deliense]|uniref:ATP-dependent RNA helicase-like protein 1 n=1 Tax=Leptotrombidium deliense TaxID=299467 RepID=A0A443RYF2_9ACAR|nr:ATP-dependent RNA helicase-like protein 1 [Leptotrombidium deliense]
MSRGVDIPVVDWVIHYDLPNNLQSYIHRSGRSGHQVGQKGNSLLLCLSHESKFVDLCVEKGIQLTSVDSKTSDLISLREKVTKWLRNEERKSAKIYESGMKAFVSFIRTYNSKNIMSQVLFKELDVVDLANSYGLIKIPHMPELKGKLKSSLTAFASRDKDKLIAGKHKDEMQQKRKTSTNAINDKDEKRKKLKAKRQRLNKKIKASKLKGKKKKHLVDYLDMKELAEDAKVVKKLKKGKISERDFDDHFNI